MKNIDQTELNYLKQNYPNLSQKALTFYDNHPNTGRLFEEHDNIQLLDYLQDLPIHDFSYEYPYQFNEYLREILKSQPESKNQQLSLYTLDPTHTINEIYLIQKGLI